MIGLFDSGIGGLTVVRELLRQAPDASFVYLGDTARTPYGNKSKETIERYSLENAAFLLSHGATSIVIACNTASALAVDALRKAYPAVPIFEVITPAVEDALAATHGRVGVIATRATIGSGIYQAKLKEARSWKLEAGKGKQGLFIQAIACPLFVPLVEEGWLNDDETKRIARRYLSSLRQTHVDTLILGCTHYPLLAPIIQRFMGKQTMLVDSAASVIRRVLASGEIDRRGEQKYFLTDLSTRSTEIARTWLAREIVFALASVSA